MSLLRTVLVASALPLFMTLSNASADEFYKGKTLIVNVLNGPGGTVDFIARLAGRYLSRHIPGNPNVVFVNKPGADGIVGANYMFNQAPHDGTEIAATLNSVAFHELFYGARSVAKYDAKQFVWLGSPSKFVLVGIAWNTSPIKKWQDLLGREMIVGSGGIGSGGTIDALILKNILGFKYHLILGYPSGADTDLAMIRGEIDGRASTAWDAITNRYPDWVRDKKISVLFQYGLEKDPDVPAEVPLLMDQIQDNDQRQVLKLRMASDELGYPVFAPPGVPPERVAMLRKAYDDIFTDPDFLADAAKARIAVSPVSGERITQLVNDAYGAGDQYKVRLQQASLPSEQFDQAKTLEVSSTLSEVAAKGSRITFTKDGKEATATIAPETHIKISGQEAHAANLTVGLKCSIDYFGDKGQAKSLDCK